MRPITVVGGGLAGLVAAVECAEAGAPTRLLEARRRLGGRGTSSPGPYVTGLGPHAFYAGGPMWDWLRARDLHRPYRRPRTSGIRLRWNGGIRRTPPAAFVRGATTFRHEAPIDLSLREWIRELAGADAATAIAGAAGVLTFDHDPGRLSARFVAERFPRVLLRVPPAARYVVGGWVSVIDRLATHARRVGVQIETGAKVDDRADLGSGPVIVALDPRGARTLLGDESLRVESPRVALLDVGLESRRGDPYVVSDLDEAAFVDRFTEVDATLAPPGHDLVQASIGMRPGEPLDAAVTRIEAILDAAFADWRSRERWRRRATVSESTGALDLPGTTWRDRPAIEHGSSVLLAGDWVAAPGHLSEVSCASAVRAAELAVTGGGARREHMGRTHPRRPATLR